MLLAKLLLETQGYRSFAKLLHHLVQRTSSLLSSFNSKCACNFPFVCAIVGLGMMFFIVIQADATLIMEQRHFVRASLEYVFLLQEVQERKKFEFVETVSVCLLHKRVPHIEY
jgi:hypothetical protein